MRCRRRKLQCAATARRAAGTVESPLRPARPGAQRTRMDDRDLLARLAARPRQRRSPRPRGRHHPGRDLEADRGLARGRRGDRRARRTAAMRSSIRWTCSTRRAIQDGALIRRARGARGPRGRLVDRLDQLRTAAPQHECAQGGRSARRTPDRRPRPARAHLGLAAGGASVPLASRGISAAGWRDWAGSAWSPASPRPKRCMRSATARQAQVAQRPGRRRRRDAAQARRPAGRRRRRTRRPRARGDRPRPQRAHAGRIRPRHRSALVRPGHARRNAHAQRHRRDGAVASVAGAGRRSTATASRPSSRATPAIDALAGRPIVLHQHDGKRNAVAEGLAPDGALRVRLDDGQVRVVHSGEVSVRTREA